ncbi:MAG TPA: sigma-70 family RNA polymerase sigma factor [Planctomycetota bacterium]|nr:sigma-70 family RNA polymerase sigma factor [Planctomycetota bacterium]
MTVEKQLVKQFLEQRDVLLGYLLALTRNPASAEEIFQEVALVILEEAGKGAEVTYFPAWAREIARRRALEYFRRQSRNQRHEPLDEAYLAAVDHSFAEVEWTAEEIQLREDLLRQCLAKLGGKAREAIELRYRGERSLSEIAATMHWQIESVKVALSRARKVLSECVQAKLKTHEAME